MADGVYCLRDKKVLKSGFTTGACAAAACKAAVSMLLTGRIVSSAEIWIPKGFYHEFVIHDAFAGDGRAFCAVVKESGDDPDVTDGVKICAEARFSEGSGVQVLGGEGVGVVTKKGLSVKQGSPAINPVPLAMIINEVTSVIGEGRGVTVEISVPGGAEIAQRTFNPKLGIAGGISIIGTTGVVSPMSEEAFKDCIHLELSMKRSEGVNDIVLTPGNYGQNFAVNSLGINSTHIVNISNFLGYALEKSVQEDFNSIHLVGHIGKLIKTAGGIFHTHSRVSDARLEIMAANYTLFTESVGLIRKILSSNTTEEALDYIENPEFYNHITLKIRDKCSDYIYGSKPVYVTLFSEVKGLLWSTWNGYEKD